MKPPNEREERQLIPNAELPECPDCWSTDSRVQTQQHTFRYGTGVSATDLSCELPVIICNQCGAQWTGPEAEDARHEAVCRYLGRLTPDEVRGVREKYRLSQYEFSRISGLGEASLSRWETGAQIQNAASDRLLRLIDADERNFCRLQQKANAQDTGNVRFRVITVTPELRKQQAAFRLRRTA